MAARRTTVFFLLLCEFIAVFSIKDGVLVPPCTYQVVALVDQINNMIICSGATFEDELLQTSQLCGAALEEALAKVPVVMYYGDGYQSVNIPPNFKGTVFNGVYQMDITGLMQPNCATYSEPYKNRNDIDQSTCKIVGYGGNKQDSKVFDAKLFATQLTKSTSSDCCKVIFKSLTAEEKGTLIDKSVPLNCVAAFGAPCETGDLGAPAYCMKKGATGEKDQVLVGFVASAPCVSGGTFLLHDVNGNADFKFGVGP